MRSTLVLSLALAALATTAAAQQPALTIYNDNFGVVRETIRLDLQEGVNDVRFTETTAFVEPDSVILRSLDPAREIVVREQNYRADPLSQELLLSLYEGQTIEFLVTRPDGSTEIVQGTIIRSGFVPSVVARDPYMQAQMYRGGYPQNQPNQPIIEVDGKLRFNLPGVPLFPALADDTVLKPTLHWQLTSNKAGAAEAELCYVTGQMSWKADYNLIAPEEGDVLSLIGWVTMTNNTGRTFDGADIKLMAGDVSKVQPEYAQRMGGYGGGFDYKGEPGVTEREFDEYHLYTLAEPTTLHDRETKQVEFVRAEDVKMTRFYVYNGAQINPDQYRGWQPMQLLQEASYGTQTNKKVWVMCEFMNSEENHLGVPMPKGRLRFYRRDGDQLEFTGEDNIDHMPKGELVRVYTGNAFDIVGERIRTNFNIDHNRRMVDESFEIKLRNHKEEPVEVRVVEDLYRWNTWTIAAASDEWKKTDSQTIEFRVNVAPDEEKVVTYTVHYTW